MNASYLASAKTTYGYLDAAVTSTKIGTDGGTTFMIPALILQMGKLALGLRQEL
jgi:hypothetical protein